MNRHEKAKAFNALNDIQKARHIARHYLSEHSLASSIIHSIETMDYFLPSMVDKEKLCDYIIECANKIKQEHIDTFGIDVDGISVPETFESVFVKVKEHMQYHYKEWYIVDIVNSPVGTRYVTEGKFDHEYIDTANTLDEEHTGFIYLPYNNKYIKVTYYT